MVLGEAYFKEDDDGVEAISGAEFVDAVIAMDPSRQITFATFSFEQIMNSYKE